MAAVCTMSAFATVQARNCSSKTACAPSAPLQLRAGRWQRAAGRQAGCLRVQAVMTAEKAEMDVSKMSPLGDRLLVKPQEVEKQTAGGILLAPTSSGKSMQDALVGTVLAVGDAVDVGVAVGDRVLFSKYSSSDVEVPDGEVCFVAQKSILAKLS